MLNRDNRLRYGAAIFIRSQLRDGKYHEARGPVEFIDRVIKRDGKGEPFSLAPYQHHVLKMALR